MEYTMSNGTQALRPAWRYMAEPNLLTLPPKLEVLSIFLMPCDLPGLTRNIPFLTHLALLRVVDVTIRIDRIAYAAGLVNGLVEIEIAKVSKRASRALLQKRVKLNFYFDLVVGREWDWSEAEVAQARASFSVQVADLDHSVKQYLPAGRIRNSVQCLVSDRETVTTRAPYIPMHDTYDLE